MEKPSLFRRLRRALWFATAGLVILVAVLLSLTRLLLPGLQGYRAQVETQASAALGQPVRISTLSSRLRGLSLVVVLEGLALRNASDEFTVAQFREVEIGFDPLTSLRRLQPVMTSLTVVGADLTIVRQADGRLEVQGLAGTGDDGGAAEGIGRWLLAQDHLALLDSRLHWRDLKTGRSLDFERVAIELQNRSERHQLNVDIALPPGAGRDLRLALDLEGDVLVPGAWRGRGHLQGHGLRPAPWLEEWAAVAGVTLQHGVFDLALWGEWDAGRLVRADGMVEVDALALRAPHGSLALPRAVAAASWQRHADGWEMRLDELRLWRRVGDTAERVQARLHRTDSGWDLQLGALRLEDLALLAPLLPQLDATQRAALATLQPRGRLRDVRARLAADGSLSHLQGRLEQAAWAPWQQLPGVTGLNGHGVWNAAHGQITLDGRDATLALPQLFRAPLRLAQMQGELGLRHDHQGWRVTIDELQLANADIQLTLAATLALPPDATPYLDLRGSFRNGHAVTVPHYLPAGIMGQEALGWLDEAFRAGTVTQGGVLFHGPLAAFPFDQAEGRFEVDFHARDVELFLQTGWPSLRQVGARVVFLNRGMVIEADSGRMYGSRIHGARVAIDDLHRPLLTVQGTARLQGDDALRLLRDTPLQQRVGEYVAGLRLEGESELALEFGLPLTAAVEQSRPFWLTGAVTLQDNRLWVEDVLPIEAIAGRLDFTDSGLRAERLTVRLLDGPASLAIYGEGEGAAARTVIAGRGEFQAAALPRLHATPLLAGVRGGSAWQGLLTIPQRGGSEGTRLWLSSDLTGVAVELPHPLGKPQGQARGLELAHHFSGPRRGQLQLAYGDDVQLQLLLDPQHGMRRGAVHFGSGVASLPERDELHVSGTLRDLSLEQWRDALRGGKDKEQNPGLGLPLRLAMDELQLAAAADDGDDVADNSAWNTLPSMEVAIARFGHGALALEQLTFSLHSSAEAMQLNDLKLTAPSLQLTGQGRWQLRPRSYSEMKLQLESPDVGNMLQHLGVASVITRGKTSSQAELNWPGPLQSFALATLSGTIAVNIDDGLMDEVEPGAGRLLGLLSLQALPRRLILDFRDLFQKGLSFSNIRGDISLRAGDAYTSNLVLESTSATVRVEGRTGLVARDYDQTVTVVPNLSGTAPVVGTLAFGPQVGAVMLLFQRLLKKNVDEAARSEYHVTGSWDQPVIEKMADPVEAPDVPAAGGAS